MIRGEKEAKPEEEKRREHSCERGFIEGMNTDKMKHSSGSMENEEYNNYLVLCIVDYYKNLLKVGYRDKSYDQCKKYKKFIKEEAKSLIRMKILYHKFISDFDTGHILYTCIMDKEE